MALADIESNPHHDEPGNHPGLSDLSLYKIDPLRVQIFSAQGETACRDAQHWRVLECAHLN
jgi:hypothetical protein